MPITGHEMDFSVIILKYHKIAQSLLLHISAYTIPQLYNYWLAKIG